LSNEQGSSVAASRGKSHGGGHGHAHKFKMLKRKRAEEAHLRHQSVQGFYEWEDKLYNWGTELVRTYVRLAGSQSISPSDLPVGLANRDCRGCVCFCVCLGLQLSLIRCLYLASFLTVYMGLTEARLGKVRTPRHATPCNAPSQPARLVSHVAMNTHQSRRGRPYD
jgi:hypothetical protein